jgi:hypothetical protein
MGDENPGQDTALHSLLPLAEFKAILGLDDREDKMCRFCLITATFAIEEHCKRRLFLKRHFERIEPYGDLLLPLREYPVREVLAVYAVSREQGGMNNGELLEPEFYRVVPDVEAETGEGPEDTVYSLLLSPAVARKRLLAGIKAVYRAGYGCGEAPPDLASACLELAAWSLERYRGRRIGVTGNAKNGEGLESSMPENVRQLLGPYKRRVI